MSSRLRHMFRPSKTNPDTSPSRINPLLRRFSALHERSKEKPDTVSLIPHIIPKLQMAAYLIKEAEGHAATQMIMAVTPEIPWEQGETAPAFPVVVPLWKKPFINDENRSNAMHINLEIVKARLEHLESLQAMPLPEIDDRSYDLIRARSIRNLKFIRSAVQGDKSVRKEIAKEVGVAAATGLLTTGLLSFLTAKLSMIKAAAVWFAAIPVAIATLAGLGVFLTRKAQQNIEAHKLAGRDYEGQAEKMQEALESHNAQFSADAAEAVKTCDDGLDDLIAGLLKMVGQETRTKAAYALQQGLGPYWEEA